MFDVRDTIDGELGFYSLYDELVIFFPKLYFSRKYENIYSLPYPVTETAISSANINYFIFKCYVPQMEHLFVHRGTVGVYGCEINVLPTTFLGRGQDLTVNNYQIFLDSISSVKFPDTCQKVDKRLLINSVNATNDDIVKESVNLLNFI